MLVFQNNVFNGYLPDKTLQMLEKNVTFKEILESEMFLIRMEIYKNSLKQLLKKIWSSSLILELLHKKLPYVAVAKTLFPFLFN